MYLMAALARFLSCLSRLEFSFDHGHQACFFLLSIGILHIFWQVCLKFFYKRFKLWRAGDNVSFCHFIAFIDKAVEYFGLDSVVFEHPVEDVGDEYARLLGSKGGAHLEKDKSVSKCAVLVTDKLSHGAIQQGFMPVMKSLVSPTAVAPT
jgi:hypothetical protein